MIEIFWINNSNDWKEHAIEEEQFIEGGPKVYKLVHRVWKTDTNEIRDAIRRFEEGEWGERDEYNQWDSRIKQEEEIMC